MRQSDGGVQVEGLPGLIRAVTALAPVTQRAADQSIGGWAVDEQNRVRAAARRSDRTSKMVSASVRAATGKGGRISAGGPGRLPSGTGTYGDVFFGAEFGGGARPTTKQFRPYRSRGYWFFPTIEADEATTLITAAEVGLDAAADVWAD